ncbi:hypothetical protein TSAR_009215 [Trichomalopsis sarcophagae]|uniref:Uncharacterized protein n=1 Tax=Trichomalopsis sarcophagae TaxID=543379 RepID=A0A232F1E8_9HYME|nr:hypothetical protein TSAR_009215 [Trichomalopsis sarcophagae]
MYYGKPEAENEAERGKTSGSVGDPKKRENITQLCLAIDSLTSCCAYNRSAPRVRGCMCVTYKTWV